MPELNFQTFMDLAPFLLLVYLFFRKEKLFVTPQQLTEMKTEIIKEVSQNFLSLIVFKEFEKRMETNFENIDNRMEEDTERFNKIDQTLEHIVDLIIKKGK